jgi:hypothetical protein
MEDLEFLEAHAVVGKDGQQWPVYQGSRDKIIAEHIKQTEKELNHD